MQASHSNSDRHEPTTTPRVYVFASELERMADAMSPFPDTETGGTLFGYWTHSGAPVIHVATGPGPSARHQSTSFNQDANFMVACTSRLHEAYALVHAGEWHSHHRIGLRHPSGGDINTVWSGIDAHGWDRFLLMIGNFEPVRASNQVSIGAFLFDRRKRTVEEAEVIILGGESPLRLAANSSLLDIKKAPSPLRVTPRRPGFTRAEHDNVRRTEYWHETTAGRRRLTQEIKGLNLLESLGVQARITPEEDVVRVHIHLREGTVLDWKLSEGFPTVAPRLRSQGRIIEINWNPDEFIAGYVNRMIQERPADEQPEKRQGLWSRWTSGRTKPPGDDGDANGNDAISNAHESAEDGETP